MTHHQWHDTSNSRSTGNFFQPNTESVELQRTVYNGLGAFPEENTVIHSTTLTNSTTNTYRDKNTSVIFQRILFRSPKTMSLFFKRINGGVLLAFKELLNKTRNINI